MLAFSGQATTLAHHASDTFGHAVSRQASLISEIGAGLSREAAGSQCNSNEAALPTALKQLPPRARFVRLPRKIISVESTAIFHVTRYPVGR